MQKAELRPPHLLTGVPGKVLAFGLVLLVLAIPRVTRPWLIRASGLVAFYALVILILRGTKTWHELVRLRGRPLALTLGVCAALFAFCCWYLSLYHFVAVWDEIGYWRQTLQFNERVSVAPVGALYDAFTSANTVDYNDLQSWVYSLPVALFPAWTSTMLCELVLFTMPSALVLSAFVTSKLPKSVSPRRRSAVLCAVYLASLCSPILLRPVLDGYLDEAPALLLVAVMAALFDEGLPRRTWSTPLIGVGIIGTFLLRRWFAYAAVALAVVVLAYWVIVVMTCRHGDRELVRLVLRAGLLVVGGAAVPLVLFFRGFVVRAVTGNYATAYSPWTTYEGYPPKLADLALSYGWGWLVLGLVAYAVGAIRDVRSARGAVTPQTDGTVRRERVDRWLLPPTFLVGALVGALLFWQTQDFFPQHYLICVFYLDAAVALPLAGLVAGLERRTTCLGAGATLAALAGVSLVLGLGTLPVHAVAPLPFGHQVFEPKVQDNVEAKYELVDYLAEEAPGTEVYFAAASEDLNSSLVSSRYLPSTFTPFVARQADVDLRNGFNTTFFACDYVVASDPTAYHLAPESEQVVGTLNALVRDSTSYLGRHYELVKSFDFGQGTTAEVYRRTSAVGPDDVSRLEATFDTLYPQWPELFHDRFESYKRKLE